jgi:putative ABC transport system substrate-binding protein
MRRIGMLVAHAESDRVGQARVAGFRERLQKLGWAEGRNIRIDTRWTEPGDAETRQRFAKELVALQPDLILSHATPNTAALLQQTRTIPIVFAFVADPVGSGFVASFPRPGGNATGFTNFEPTMAGKWLELLKDIAPRVSRAAFLFNPSTATNADFLNSFKAAAISFGVEPIVTTVRDASELETVIAAQASEPNGGLIVMADIFTLVHRAQITSLSDRYRLPAVYPYRQFAEIGGLLSYGVDLLENFWNAATYADRILKGEKPSELPVQAPVKFELVINLKTARTLGLTVPPSLLATADEVIE